MMGSARSQMGISMLLPSYHLMVSRSRSHVGWLNPSIPYRIHVYRPYFTRWRSGMYPGNTKNRRVPRHAAHLLAEPCLHCVSAIHYRAWYTADRSQFHQCMWVNNSAAVGQSYSAPSADPDAATGQG